MRICNQCSDLTLFYLSLIRADVCLSTVQIVIASQKSKKSKRIAAYVWFKFLGMWKGIS
jgi:hypothetical protein